MQYTAQKPGGPSYANELRDPADLQRFDQFFQQLSQDFKKNEAFIGLTKTPGVIIQTGPGVRASVFQKIKEPFRV